MKRIILISTLYFSMLTANCQIITENVYFDNFISSSDNDLSNYFNFGGYQNPATKINQVSNGGITGGALEPRNSIDEFNDVIIYCSKFKNVINNKNTTSISFKQNNSLVNSNSSLDAVSLTLSPENDGNHYIRAMVENDKIGFITLLSGQPISQNLNLQSGNWYNLSLSSTIIGGQFGDKIKIEVELFNLGTLGNSSPLLVDSIQRVIYDNFIATDTSTRVLITSSKWGGAELVDNFYFKGLKNNYSCSNSLGINEISLNTFYNIYPNPSKGTFNISSNNSIKEVILYDIQGNEIEKINCNNENHKNINLEHITNGLYIIELKSPSNSSKFQRIQIN
jgi:hypothetical protein